MAKQIEIGKIYEKNKVISYIGDNYYKVVCIGCNEERNMWKYNILRQKGCKSCSHVGTLRVREKGGKIKKEYIAYKAMIARCKQTMESWKKKHQGTIYEGMEIEEDWLKDNGFEIFYSDIGPAFEGAILDRIDNAKGYLRGNVRWANTSESNKNKKNAHLITAFGRTQNLVDWSKESGLSSECIFRRIRVYGWSPEKAISTKVNRKDG